MKNRIEFQSLQTQKRLQQDDLNYYEWSFLPSLSLYGGYSYNYESKGFPQLYSTNYPSSYVGLQLSIPIFEGGKRYQEIKQAQLELDLFDYDFISFKNSVNTEYAQAMANYKSDLNNYHVLNENLELAKDVYKPFSCGTRREQKRILRSFPPRQICGRPR